MFKDNSYLDLGQLLFSMEGNHLCNFDRVHHEGTILGNHFEFGPVVQEEMPFKDISYLELLRPLCSEDRNHLCNFGRRHHEEQFCELFLFLDQWFRMKCSLKVFLIWHSGSPFVQQSGTICAILVEGIMSNTPLKLF